MIQLNSTAAGHAAALMTIIIWGITFVSTKILLVDFSPLEILVLRFAMGYLTLLAIHPRIIKPNNLQHEFLFASAGFCGVTMYFLLENIALTYTLASNVGIIASTAPFFTAVLAHFFLKDERLRPQFFAGFILAMTGIVLIALNGSYILKLNPTGDLLAIAACVFWAMYSILMRKIGALGHATIGCTRRVFLYGLLFMTPVTLWTDFHWGLERLANPVNLFNLLFLGLGASALCFVTWNWCMGVLGAVKTSSYIYLVPVVTLIASHLILQEHITVTALVGAALTLAGLLLSERKIADKTADALAKDIS